jgi:hypothetical protein
MRFADLEPEWVNDAKPGGGHRRDDALDVASAQGVMFLCPLCFQKNNGPAGTHSILVWFRGRGVPDEASPGPGRWEVSGRDFDDLTVHPSINLEGGSGCHWHGWLQHGFCKDGGIVANWRRRAHAMVAIGGVDAFA